MYIFFKKGKSMQSFSTYFQSYSPKNFFRLSLLLMTWCMWQSSSSIMATGATVINTTPFTIVACVDYGSIAKPTNDQEIAPYQSWRDVGVYGIDPVSAKIKLEIVLPTQKSGLQKFLLCDYYNIGSPASGNTNVAVRLGYTTTNRSITDSMGCMTVTVQHLSSGGVIVDLAKVALQLAEMVLTNGEFVRGEIDSGPAFDQAVNSLFASFGLAKLGDIATNIPLLSLKPSNPAGATIVCPQDSSSSAVCPLNCSWKPTPLNLGPVAGFSFKNQTGHKVTFEAVAMVKKLVPGKVPVSTSEGTVILFGAFAANQVGVGTDIGLSQTGVVSAQIQEVRIAVQDGQSGTAKPLRNLLWQCGTTCVLPAMTGSAVAKGDQGIQGFIGKNLTAIRCTLSEDAQNYTLTVEEYSSQSFDWKQLFTRIFSKK
jgi:hypothetical protein